MAGKPQDRQMIQNERAKRADGGEPLYDPEMSLYKHGGSTGINLPSVACKIHDFEVGDTARVEIYPSGIWIGTEGDHE